MPPPLLPPPHPKPVFKETSTFVHRRIIMSLHFPQGMGFPEVLGQLVSGWRLSVWGRWGYMCLGQATVPTLCAAQSPTWPCSGGGRGAYEPACSPPALLRTPGDWKGVPRSGLLANQLCCHTGRPARPGARCSHLSWTLSEAAGLLEVSRALRLRPACCLVCIPHSS